MPVVNSTRERVSNSEGNVKMKQINIFITAIIIFISSSAYSENTDEAKDHWVLLIKTGDGLFLYNFMSQEHIKVFTFANEYEYIEPSEVDIIDNKLSFIVAGKDKRLLSSLSRKKYINKYKKGFYIEKQYLITLDSFQTYLFKEIKSEIKDSLRFVTEFIYSQTGKIIDTVQYSTPEMPIIKFLHTRVDETEEVNGIKVGAQKGNLYIKEPGKEWRLLLRHWREFKVKDENYIENLEIAKFGRGYISPALSRDGRKVIFIDIEASKKGLGFLKRLFKGVEKSTLIEMDLTTLRQKKYELNKLVTVFRAGVSYPQYSYTNRYVLFMASFRNEKYCVLDLKTKKMYELPRCQFAIWVY